VRPALLLGTTRTEATSGRRRTSVMTRNSAALARTCMSLRETRAFCKSRRMACIAAGFRSLAASGTVCWYFCKLRCASVSNCARHCAASCGVRLPVR
jgi:hypothetical protein